MKVLITGAGGQDGNHIANMYHLLGNNVLGLLNPKSQSANFQFPIVKLDFSDPKSAHHLLNDYKPDLIFHLAAVHHASSQKVYNKNKLVSDMFKCHVSMTKNILDWQKKNVNTSSLFALTSQMYSLDKSGHYINENSVVDPQNIYGKTKELAFSLIKKYRNRFHLNSHAAILFNHTSIRSKKQFIFPQLADQLRKLLSEETSKISLAEPEAELDITHSDEICEGLMRQIELSKPSDLVYAQGRSIKISDLVLQFLDEVRYETKVEIVKNGQKVNSTLALIGDSSKAQALIGWHASKTPLEILLELFHKQRDGK